MLDLLKSSLRDEIEKTTKRLVALQFAENSLNKSGFEKVKYRVTVNGGQYYDNKLLGTLHPSTQDTITAALEAGITAFALRNLGTRLPFSALEDHLQGGRNINLDACVDTTFTRRLEKAWWLENFNKAIQRVANQINERPRT